MPDEFSSFDVAMLRCRDDIFSSSIRCCLRVLHIFLRFSPFFIAAYLISALYAFDMLPMFLLRHAGDGRWRPLCHDISLSLCCAAASPLQNAPFFAFTTRREMPPPFIDAIFIFFLSTVAALRSISMTIR